MSYCRTLYVVPVVRRMSYVVIVVRRTSYRRTVVWSHRRTVALTVCFLEHHFDICNGFYLP